MDNAKFVEEGNPHDLLLSKLDSKQLEVYHRIYQEIENKILKNDKKCIENFNKCIDEWYEDEFDWGQDENYQRLPLTDKDIPAVFNALLSSLIGWMREDFSFADVDKFDEIYCEVDECLLYPKIYLPEKATTEMYISDSSIYYEYESLSFVEAEEPDTRDVYNYSDYWKWGSIGIYVDRDTNRVLLHGTQDDTYTIVNTENGMSDSGSMSDIRLE